MEEVDASVESALSRSEESESRVLRDGCCGVEHDGQLHGANLWYSAMLLRFAITIFIKSYKMVNFESGKR